ncbi:MAG: endonuclease [Bacteroidales bacterium]|nr:endonuclease [Bacteroidales bacterium]MCL2132821.1 endonuclease [Bacteroidales bacterium]
MKLIPLLLVLLLPCLLQGQEAKVMFYNVENFFDPFDDPKTQDEEFTPTGKKRWTWQRLAQKRSGIAKTIIAAGEGDAPVLVGFAEVENFLVLKQLVEQTPLARIGYGIVHHDSPDPRGIEVALLYRNDRFKLLHRHFYKLRLPSGSSRTREILYAKGVLDSRDTLHVLVNHWPSKLGNAQQSLAKRMTAARKAKAICDSIFGVNPSANILVMGDFNDSPESLPIVKGLAALPPDTLIINNRLYNLMLPLAKRGEGSYKYKSEWEMIDLFFVSGNMLLQSNGIKYKNAYIFKADFLLEEDKKHHGKRPFRTYEGMKYLGGVSDHLPVVMIMKPFID